MITKLLESIKQFQKGQFLSMEALFVDLRKGQHPETLFITCSDSRLNPHLLTQSEPGHLFIIRNAGNIVPPYESPSTEAGTIEYAVSLGIQEIIICGHVYCGAMIALLNPNLVSSMPAVRHLLDHAIETLDHLEPNPCHHQSKAHLNAAVEQNVLTQVQHLKTHPSVLRASLKQALKIYAWVYHFDTGKVFIYSPQTKQFLPSDEVREDASLETALSPPSLNAIVQEEAARYLNPLDAASYCHSINVLAQIKNHGLSVIWDAIRENVTDRIFSDYRLLFNSRDDQELIDLVLQGESIELETFSQLEATLENSIGCRKYHSQLLRESGLFASMVQKSEPYPDKRAPCPRISSNFDSTSVRVESRH